MDHFTIVACLFIIISFLAAWRYVVTTTEKQLNEREKWICQLPSFISTLGVLGTFIGITKGLAFFDTQNLVTSIPLLLDGLKTAFLTSLLGMTGSLILNHAVSRKLDRNARQSEVQKCSQAIIRAVESLGNSKSFNSLCTDVEQLKDDLEEIKGHTEEVKSMLSSIQNSCNLSTEELPRIRAVMLTATASISAIDNNIDRIEDYASQINEKINDKKKSFDDVKE